MRRRGRGRMLVKPAVLLLSWAVVAATAATLLFFQGSAATVVAGHDAEVSPTLDGYATLDLGPYLPNVRYPTDRTLGTRIDLGTTNLTSYRSLVERYATIASEPEGQVAKVRSTLFGLARDSVVTGGVLALAVPGLWLVLGPRRRAELFRYPSVRPVAVTGLAAVLVAAALVRPWNLLEQDFQQPAKWQPVGQALPDVPVPADAAALEVQAGLMTSGTKRLVESALDTYARSLRFYRDVRADAHTIGDQLRQPADDETVALLVTDRHDNVGMDKVARAIADQGGATMLLDAGDDTSTGSTWEAFSLDSLNEAFADFDRFAVSGNHDHGEFVSDYLADLGFTHLDGDVVDGPDDITLLGVDDPRSSGLGTWRDEPGESFAEHERRVADIACEHNADGDRVNTLLLHDANSGREALARGCVDLVLAGHLHAQLGPTPLTGANGRVGYTYTNGTTGGAAYALAIGSKLRRDAQVTLVTYRDGRPVGLQPVTVRTVGDFRVGDYIELDHQQQQEQ